MGNLFQAVKAGLQVFKQAPNPVVVSSVMPWDTNGRLQPGNYQAMIDSYYSWVYACATCNARNIAGVPLRLYKRTSAKKEEWEEILEHPFLDLMAFVNPMSDYNELMELTSVYQDVVGNCYWYLPSNRLKLPAEIWALEAQYVKVVPNKDTFIGGYVYQPAGIANAVHFTPEEIIHFKLPNPGNKYYGSGCVEAARYSVDSNEYQKKFERGTFKNGTTPGTVLTSDQPINESIAERILANWKKFHSGIEKTGEPAILGSGLKIDRLSLTPQELSFLAGQEMTRKEICAMFGTPEAMLGYISDANRANMEALIYIYMSQTILPRLRRIELKINAKLVSRYGDKTLYAEFDNPVPDDKEYKLKEREVNLRTGFQSPNEARLAEGMGEVDGGDRPLVPFTLVPLGGQKQVIPAPAPAAGAEAMPAKHVKKEYTQRQLNKLTVFKVAQEKDEARFAATMAGYFGEQEKMVQRNLNKYKAYRAKKVNEDDIDYIIFPESEDGRLLIAARLSIREALASGVEIATAEVGIDFTLTNPHVAEWIETRAGTLLNVNDTTREAIRQTLAEGIKANEAVAKLSDRIAAVYGEAKDYRAVRIARTETAAASNAGQEMVYAEAGVETKEWIVAEAPCPEICSPMAGATVKIGESFNEDGPPAHPNCLCTILSV